MFPVIQRTYPVLHSSQNSAYCALKSRSDIVIDHITSNDRIFTYQQMYHTTVVVYLKLRVVSRLKPYG